MQKYSRRPVAAAILSFVFFAVVGAMPTLSQEALPPGLTDPDPLVRLIAVQEAGRKNIRDAEEQVAKMAKNDPFAGVREAACTALQDLKATWQLDLLSDIAANDSDPAVRNAAATAVSTLRRDLDRDTALNPTPDDKEYYREPALLSVGEEQPETRVFGIGLGIMGGYGVIGASLRGKIPTGIKYLPWIGIEAGTGWTPPALYVVTAGPVDTIDSDDKWQIISGGGAVLLYPHRMHYAAVRGGFDIGRGGYIIVGYGFEMLNEEGFLSWGVEAGVLVQPAIDDRIDRLTTCDEKGSCDAETWPAIPVVRFSLHFYPI
jgi:hypothetical protein